jgi:hypothetical protein
LNIEGENDQRKEGVQICPEESSNSIDNLIKQQNKTTKYNASFILIQFIILQNSFRFFLLNCVLEFKLHPCSKKSFSDD